MPIIIMMPACSRSMGVVRAHRGAVNGTWEVADPAGDYKLGAGVSDGFRGGDHARVATEVAGTKGETERILGFRDVIGFLDAQGGLHQRNNGDFAVHAGEAFSHMVSRLGLVKHHPKETRVPRRPAR